MDFIKHPQHTRFIGKPRDWDEKRDGECGTLSVSDKLSNGYPVMESAWLPTAEEALALATGYAQIRLGVFGTTHPVVYMGTSPTTPDSREQYIGKLQRAAVWLHALAKSGDVGVYMTDEGVNLIDRKIA